MHAVARQPIEIPQLAMDRRTIDQDGRLRVPGCRISKANVCPYYGREIPNADKLGLDPNRVYMLYRDPEELRKAAKSFEQVPLLMVHIPITATAPSIDVVCGNVANIRFEYPYLVGDLIVTRQDAIDKINSGETEELSSAYRYEPVFQSGVSPEGLRYEMKMVSLLGNHVALVAEGRAGPDVVVADANPRGFNMRFSKFLAALMNAIKSPDDPTLVVAADAALANELEAMDADLSDEEKKTACDAYAKDKGIAADALSDEDKTEAYKRAAADKKRARDEAVAVPVPASAGMDEATVNAKIAAAVAEARTGYVLASDAAPVAADQLAAARAAGAADVRALFEARALVAPKVGDVSNVETAEGVFRFALDHLKVDHKDIPASALAALYKSVSTATPAPAVALDAASAVAVSELFPVSHIRRS
jgi:hypothetical protein